MFSFPYRYPRELVLHSPRGVIQINPSHGKRIPSLVKKLLIRVILRVTFVLSMILSMAFKKKSNRVVFSSAHGEVFAGNSKWLFDHMVTNRADFDCYWITKNEHLYRELKNRYGDSVAYLLSPRGIKKVITARTVVLDNKVHDFPYVYLSKKHQNIIQLWHGIPIRKILFLSRLHDSKEKGMFNLVLGKPYRALISTSDVVSYLFSACFEVNFGKIYITGYPRNDVLFKRSDKHELIEKLSLNFPPFEKLILYAPTFREKKNVRFFPFIDLNMEQLNSFLEEQKAIILIRGHLYREKILNQQKDGFTNPTSNRIIELDWDKLSDTQEILRYIDVVITDYSSIYVDFLLLDRPVVFVPYDFDEYAEKMGFLFNYEWITPGPKVYTMQQFTKALLQSLNDISYYQPQREQITKLFHKYRDGNSSKRVVELIKKLL